MTDLIDAPTELFPTVRSVAPMRRSGVVMSPLLPKSKPVTTGVLIDVIRQHVILPETRRPMELHQYQLDLIEWWNDPGSKADATVIGAGNAKTTTFAAFLTALLYTVEEHSIPVVAETITQATLTTWGRMKRMVELNPELLARSEILEGQGSRRGIYVPGMAGHCFAIADNPAGLQGLNPSVVALEEMSEASMATFSALMNRLGKRPAGSLNKVIGISTPSFTPDNALLTVQRDFHSGNPTPGVRLREYVSDQRDHRDESQWWKANPGLACGVLQVEAVRADLLNPEQRFRAYRLCQNPVGSESCWLNALDDHGDEIGDAYDVWKRCASPHAMVDGAPTWVGADVAKSRDHAAVVWAQERPDGRLHTKAKIWTPSATADIDQEAIADHIRHLCGRYDVKIINYDPSYFTTAAGLAAEGLPMLETPPTNQRMAPYVGHAYQAIRRSQITHDDHDQYTLHVLAGRRRYNPHGFVIEKRNFAHKCDAAIALVLAFGAYNEGDLATLPTHIPATDLEF